jgi:ribonuclease BN (tRNA processing enzyme)
LAFGGHTSCVEVEVGRNHLIFDAGTGIIPLGKQLTPQHNSSRKLHLFLSHTHHDHVFGFYFFQPLFRSRCHVSIFGPGSSAGSLAETLRELMEPRFFPVDPRDFTARTKIFSLRGGERVRLDGSHVLPRIDRCAERPSKGSVSVLVHKSLAHPNGVLLYRVWHGQKSVVYATDIEQDKSGDGKTIQFFKGADLLIHDAQYLESEYSSRSSPRRGWGHTTIERAVETARRADVKQLILFHHDPSHDDRTLRRIQRLGSGLVPLTRVAYEGMEIRL